MTGGIDKLCERIGEKISARLNPTYQSLVGDNSFKLGSPIEALFLLAIDSEIRFFKHDPHPWDSLCCLASLEDGQLRAFDRRLTDALLVQTQVRVLDWRVDFWIDAHADPASKKIIVECDGHDFHERTKEQAARDRSRDRSLQSAGYHVLRFTGSEIYRDPTRCAVETLDLASRIFWQHERK
jgi:very-short-patch-repair endonuclease